MVKPTPDWSKIQFVLLIVRQSIVITIHGDRGYIRHIYSIGIGWTTGQSQGIGL